MNTNALLSQQLYEYTLFFFFLKNFRSLGFFDYWNTEKSFVVKYKDKKYFQS